jgi:IS4 transposase
MEISAMPHHNTVLRDILKLVPWHRFEALVDEHDADARVRRLSTKGQFLALLYGQLSGASSLREIVTGLSSHAARLYHLGAVPVRRSTFSDANSSRPAEVFAELLAIMMRQAHRGLRRKLAETTYLIDATSVRLNEHSANWARFSAGVCGAKVHVIYDADADRPIYAAVSPANVNDISAARQMPIEPGATYVFDLGYYDYLWWAALDTAGCRIVTRFKSNTRLEVRKELPVPKGSNVLSDRIGFLPARQARSRRNPMQDAVREVRVTTDSGKVLRILSNDLDASADEIADLYRRRWAIELFFRWIKQTLKITRFIGTSENAVRIQIAVALIAFLLLRLAQAAQTAVKSPIMFSRLIRTNLMHRRSFANLLGHPPILQDQQQMSLSLC